MGDEAWERLMEVSDGIVSMEIRGAGKIARSAAGALRDYADSCSATDRKDLVDRMREAAGQLYSTRPSAVSLRNGILLTLKGAELEGTMEGVRKRIMDQADEFIRSSHEALERISRYGSKRIPKGSRVLTHCNSSAALSVIEAAYLDGRVEEVYSTESRPWRQGHITSRWLAERDIPVTMIVDSAVRYFMNDMDIVCVGADTITANGAVVNKIGTSLISLAAHEARTPMMVCAETYKFSVETLTGNLVEIEDRGPDEVADPLRPEEFPGVKFRNPVFDFTPPEYIDAIVTESGVISPYMATEIIREMFGDAASMVREGSRETFQWLKDVNK